MTPEGITAVATAVGAAVVAIVTAVTTSYMAILKAREAAVLAKATAEASTAATTKISNQVTSLHHEVDGKMSLMLKAKDDLNEAQSKAIERLEKMIETHQALAQGNNATIGQLQVALETVLADRKAEIAARAATVPAAATAAAAAVPAAALSSATGTVDDPIHMKISAEPPPP